MFGGIKSRVRDIIAAYKSGDAEALNRAIDAAEGYKTAKPNAAIKIRQVLSEGITDENKLSYKLKRAISGELEKDLELLPLSESPEIKAMDFPGPLQGPELPQKTAPKSQRESAMSMEKADEHARVLLMAKRRLDDSKAQPYSEATRKAIREASDRYIRLVSEATKGASSLGTKEAMDTIVATLKNPELSVNAQRRAIAEALYNAHIRKAAAAAEISPKAKADAKPEDLAVNIIKHFRELGRREGRLNRRGQVEGDAVRLPGVTKTKEGGLGYTGLTAGDSRLDAAVQRAAEMTKAPREVLHRIHRFLETADSLSDKDIAVGISRIIKTAEELSSAAGTEVKPKNVAPWEDRKVRAAMQKLHANAFLDPALAAAVAVKLAKGFVKLGGGAVSKVSKFMFRGSGETLTDAGPSGEYARRIVYPMFKLEEFKLQNQFLGILNEAARLGLSNAQWEKIGKHAYQMAEYHTSLVNLTAAEQKGYDRMRAVFDAMRMEQVQDGPLINGKVPGLTRDFAPTTVLDKRVREILNNPEKDPTAADSYRLMYENWYKQFEPNASAEEIANTLNTILGKNPYRGQKTSKFNPLETAAGIGLPPGMREQNLMNVAKFYGMRTAQGLAWYRAVQKDPIAARVFGEIDDGRGGAYVGPTEDVPLKEAGKYMIHDFSTNPEVARALTNNPDLLAYKSEMSLGATADYDLIEKATALVNAFKLGPLTTARDIVQGVFGTIGEQLRTDEIPMLYDAAVKVFSGQSEAGVRGGLRTTAAAEMAIDASLRTVLGKVADVARKYQGRDLGEKGIREVLWELGREVIKHRIDTGDTKALEFYGSKQWRRKLAEDKEKFLDLAAGRFMETMQGNYGPEYLPRWLHKSQHGYLKAIFSLSRFSVERARRYRETVIEPMAKDGNLLPFAKSTVLYLGIAAPLANTLVELITDRKPSNMSWGEWLGFVDKQGKLSTEAMDEFAYTVLANASLMGMGGIFSGALHNLNRARHGEKALWYSNPAAAAVEDFGKRIFDYWTAYSGEDFVKNLWKIPVETLVQETQSLREGRRLLEDRPDTGAREEAIWKRVTGQTKPSLMSPPQANPFSAATKIRRATTAAEIKEAYPQLEEMYKRYLPERAGRFTESKKEDGYYQFLVDTQGEPAARKQFESDEKRRQLDPLRKAAANAAFKSARRKRLTDHPELLEYR